MRGLVWVMANRGKDESSAIVFRERKDGRGVSAILPSKKPRQCLIYVLLPMMCLNQIGVLVEIPECLRVNTQAARQLFSSAEPDAFHFARFSR